MSGPANAPDTPIDSKRQLIEYIAGGGKPDPADWRIGMEHEKFGFDLKTLRPLPYDGPAGIRAMLEGLTRFGWEPVREGDNVIALSRNKESVTLEPGGQLELSGAPLETLHENCKELNRHLSEVKQVGDELGVGFMGLGFNPKWRRDDIPMMPKGRYNIMRAYMPKKGNLGLDMMFRTCTVQVNLDFIDEADMVRQMRVGLALQPVCTALFANSPFTEGKPNGFLSFRSHIWTDTDPDRTGMLPFAFEPGFGFERYVDYLLDIPMYFVYRKGRYIDMSGKSFRDFMAGKHHNEVGDEARLIDFADHLTTAFPEVRLKRYIEMRGADAGPWWKLCALPAMWVGLMYDKPALAEAADLVKDWTQAERDRLRAEVPRLGLATPFRKGTIADIARETLRIAGDGLRRRARLSDAGESEDLFLDSLRATLAKGKTPAEELLELYRTRWEGSVDPVFTELAY
ncbi:glutamate--cysteine ligase [Desertibaculum subflavum]|uniref:glutamate--cysteine ligase n=1 Tax=Desertibaculum subflavum TaxID=2268458 RepID=UPI000E663392